MILKRNIPEAWGVEAGAEEVRFYQLAATLLIYWLLVPVQDR